MTRDGRRPGLAVATLVVAATALGGVPLAVPGGAATAQQGTAQGSFVVVEDSLDAPEFARNSTEVTVNATVRNDGPARRTETVDFRVEGQGRDVVVHRNVTLAANASRELTFVLNTSGFEQGSYIVGVTTRESSGFARLELTDEARIDFDDQDSNGTTVEITQAFLPRGGYVSIYDGRSIDDANVTSVIGVSGYLQPGFYEDLVVRLYDFPGAAARTDNVTGNRTLVAVVHRETSGNRTFDFVTSNGTADGPYLDDGEPVAEADDVNATRPAPSRTRTVERLDGRRRASRTGSR